MVLLFAIHIRTACAACLLEKVQRKCFRFGGFSSGVPHAPRDYTLIDDLLDLNSPVNPRGTLELNFLYGLLFGKITFS